MTPQALATIAIVAALPALSDGKPIDIGNRRELFVDDYLIDRMDGVEQRLHHPTPREVVLVHDAPWEGSGSGYHTIFRDGDVFRMYYRAWQLTTKTGKLVTPHPFFGAYAESPDGIRWRKPSLGLFEFNGSKDNNIIWPETGAHDFTPFKDTNPACKPEARYKAVTTGPWDNKKHRAGLLAFQSRDGIHWVPMNDGKLIIDDKKIQCDTQNLAFWDSIRKEYRVYVRSGREGRRDIATATSQDFIHWTDPVWLEYPGAAKEQLYTNQIAPYDRAPHIFIGFPARYLVRGWSPSMEALPNLEDRRTRSKAHVRFGTALTESLLMSSRDGVTFRRWPEAFLRPGPQHPENWKYADHYLAWHVIETKSAIPGAPNELSLFASEGYWTDTSNYLRRYTLRIDGFVSVHGAMRGGELVTKPLVFSGEHLTLNFSTSAAGSLRVEIQDQAGKPIPGFALADCDEVFGDEFERVVSWKKVRDLSGLVTRTVRLRFQIRDADLFSLRVGSGDLLTIRNGS